MQWGPHRSVAHRGDDAAVVGMRVRLSAKRVGRCRSLWVADHDGGLVKPAVAMGDFVVLAGETFAAMFRRPFAWRELIEQIWFVARVSIVPTVVLSIPYTVLIVFTLNIVLIEVGAGDLSGAGAALASVTAGGSGGDRHRGVRRGRHGDVRRPGRANHSRRDRRDEGHRRQPRTALVVPRVIAATFVALMLYSVVAVVGLTGSYFFVVYVQNVTPGAFVAGMTLLTGLPQVIVSLVKALLFGLSAGLIACYKGLHVGGGPTAVGTAVNETVVFVFMALFLINILATAFGVKVAP